VAFLFIRGLVYSICARVDSLTAGAVKPRTRNAMKSSELLGKTFDCGCGRSHTIPTEHLVYANDALQRLPEIARGCAQTFNCLILADERTWDAAGHLVEQALRNAGASVSRLIIPDREGGSPVTDDATLDGILSVAPEAALFISVGSGVVNDLTKWAAFERGRPFITVATAASMNGYASANVSATIGGLKKLFRAEAPRAVLAVPQIIENAPFELTAAGLGDVMAKTVSSADWRLNQLLFGEYHCQFSVDLLKDLEPIYLNQAEKIRSRDAGAIRALFEALFYSSVAMTITGTSAPASGGEHLISHTLDMLADSRGVSHDLHGRQVGLGVIFCAALYQEILSIESPRFVDVPAQIDSEFWGPLTPTIKPQFEGKAAKYEQAAAVLSDPEKWREMVAAIRPGILSPAQIKNCFRQAGAAHRIEEIRFGQRSIDPEFMIQVLCNAHQMRDRFTVLDLAHLLGILPAQVKSLTAAWILN